MKASAAGCLVTMSLALAAAPGALAQPSLSVADVSVFEGNSGTTTMTFTVSRSSTGVRSSVSYTVSNGSAVGGTDFVQVPEGFLQFAAGDSKMPVQVSINGDAVAEINETIRFDLNSPVGATIADGAAIGTILNDDLPTLSVADVSMAEGNAGSVALNFVVKRSVGISDSSSVTVSTTDGTALAGSDYAALAPITLTFGSGQTTKNVGVQIIGDTSIEPNETFRVILSSPVGATIADDSATGTITNDDKPDVSIDDAEIEEGNIGTRLLAFTLKRSGDLSQTSTVSWSTANDTATAGADYVGVAATPVSFNPNQSTVTVSVTINGETVAEIDEKFKINLTNPVSANIVDSSAEGTIKNDDLATLSVSDVSLVEGNAGTSQLVFTVTRSGGGNSSVKYATSGGTATAGTDYVAVPLTTLNFVSGETSKTVPVTINGDSQIEPNENFNLVLSDPTGASIADANAVGTILTDDASLAVNDVLALEANTGTPSLTFTITRAGSLSAASSVVASTADGTSTAGSDYVALAPTTVSFQPNESTKTVTVSITPDLAFEPDETLNLNLTSPSGATIADATGVGTIRNDDNAPQGATLAINDVSVTEGTGGANSATFTITRSGDLSGTSAVVVATGITGTAREPGTGTAGDGPTDIVAVSPTTISFQPNIATRTVSVTITTDDFVENDETFVVNLTGASGATIADGTGQGTIVNDDVFALTISNASVVEGNEGTKTATFVVGRSAGLQGSSSVDFSVAGGSATSGSDFVAPAPGTLSFGPGDGSKTITVTINGDTSAEPDETFTVNLSNAQGATITDGQGIGTITNDDSTLAINDVSTAEGDKDENRTLTFTVTRAGGTSGPASVSYSTSNGTAIVGSDYAGIVPTTLSFAPGESSKQIAVTILGDGDSEPNETFTVTLSAATGAVIADGIGTGTITNDD